AWRAICVRRGRGGHRHAAQCVAAVHPRGGNRSLMPRLLRINAGAGPEYVVEREGEVRNLVGDVFGEWQEGLRLEGGLRNARVLAPVLPSKIVAVGLNYRAHAAEPEKPL